MTAKYRNKETGAYGITERQIRAEHPGTSFPAKFRSPWHDLVFPTPKPTCTNLQRVIESGPELTTLGSWQQTWEIVDKFSDYTDPEGILHTKEEQEAEFLAQEQATAIANLKKACEIAIDNLIQSVVDDYNVTNNLLFTNVHSCEAYARTDGYSHQAFCLAVWNWNVAVWEAARAILAQALAGEIVITSPDDLLALLPEFEL